MKRYVNKMQLIAIPILVLLFLGIGLYTQQLVLGKLPNEPRLAKMKSSPNYVDGQFQNSVPTPVDRSASSLWEYLFTKKERLVPVDSIPSIKTNIKAFDVSKDVVIWFGHSSYYMQLGGNRILIDPVFSSSASPVSFVNKAFAGTNLYTAEDMPEIDYLLISHDHWDHLDHPTIMALKPKIKNVVCGLGVGSYFENWGFDAKLVHEEDWFAPLNFKDGFVIHVLPARHFSGRLLCQDKTLWVGFALVTQEHRVFYSGDSGYGPHFKEIGEMFNGFDLAIFDNGQYDKSWPYIHMMPEQAAVAAEDLKTKALLPGHAGKFAIACHPWDEPFKCIADVCQNKNFRLLTPMIGEPVGIEHQQQVFSRWWEGLN